MNTTQMRPDKSGRFASLTRGSRGAEQPPVEEVLRTVCHSHLGEP